MAEEQRVLVTGGGRGIGRAVTLAFARAGAAVAVVARTGSDLEKVAGEARALGARALAIPGDISVEDDARRLVATAEDQLGGIDVLVNNAATFVHRRVVEMTAEEFDGVMATNVRGAFLMTREALRGMIRRGEGTIVMVSSTSGKRGDPGLAAYSASKHALMGFAHSLLYEVRPHGVRVVVVTPSAVDTRPLPDGKIRQGGKGARLRAEDVAASILHAATLPPRSFVREIELWATNP